ncbi:MAG: HlyD family efflux transporter periplasmic adaptor subunit [Roseibium sp.]
MIKPAEVLMEVVPLDAQLAVESRISTQNVDKLQPGQTVTLRFSVFNRNTTPELAGELVRVSPDLETDLQTGAQFYRAVT